MQDYSTGHGSIDTADSGAEIPLVLASASPRRRALLTILVAAFEVRPADIDERLEPGEAPEAYVSRLAVEKAGRISEGAPERWVIGADTAVVCDGECLGKPQDENQACEMLRSLSGRTHKVYSAVALTGPGSGVTTALSITSVQFERLPDDWIVRYVASGEPLDKAGAYAIQGQAAAWISAISGSYSGVVGLPLYETAELLRSAGLLFRNAGHHVGHGAGFGAR